MELNLLSTLDENGCELYKSCPFCKFVVSKRKDNSDNKYNKDSKDNKYNKDHNQESKYTNETECFNCKNNFCWLCLQRVNYDHYFLYNLIGCPGLEQCKYLLLLTIILT